MSASDVVLKDLDYFMSEEHSDEFGKLTEAQQAALYQGLQVEGDTTAKVETSEAPAADLLDKSQIEALEAAEAAKATEAATESVVLTKDGKHTIPFKELEDAREKARHFEQMAIEQKALLDDLAKAKEQDAATGGTEAQQAVIAEYGGEFPEVAADMKPYIEAMIAAGVSAGLAEIKGTLDAVVAPQKLAEQDALISGHFNAIRDVHKDFDAIVEGNTLDKWIETQPSFVQPALRDILDKGNATQVIELVTAYKKDAGEPAVTANTPAKPDVRQVAAEAIAKAAERGVPRSLSDFPGAGKVATNEADAVMGMGPSELSNKFDSMRSSEDILKSLSRMV